MMAEPLRRRQRFQVNPLALFSAFMFAFLIAPSVIVAMVSFSSSPYLVFPPPGFSLQWYSSFFSDQRLTEPLLLSLRIGFSATLLSVAIGTMAAWALTRYSIRGSNLLRIMLIGPMVVPYIVQATGLFQVFKALGLRGSVLSIVLAHTVIGLPYVFLVVSAGLASVPKSLEEAARVLGANTFTTFWRITLPQITASMAAGAIFAFITSFDDFIIAFFLSAATTETLPVRMFAVLRDAVDPRLSSLSTLLILANLSAVLLYQRFMARGR